MKFTLIYIIALVIFSVNGVLSGIRKTPINGVSSGKSKTLGKGVSSGRNSTLGKGLSSGKSRGKGIPSGKSKTARPLSFEGFCLGKTISDGTQIPGGSCSEGIQGVIPSDDKMPSTLIVQPPNAGEVPANTEFDVDIVVNNFVTGQFSDPKTQYNIFPQTTDESGLILGHTHVTIQELNGDVPPNSKEFAFFKGVNDQASPDGHLTVSVVSEDGKQKGLPAGDYRICAMSGAFSHQPLVMPVAKRGAQDDCIRINVK